MHHSNYIFQFFFYFITSLGNRIDKTWLGEHRLVGYTLTGLAFIRGLNKTFFSYVLLFIVLFGCIFFRGLNFSFWFIRFIIEIGPE
jgi:hypothetical protein